MKKKAIKRKLKRLRRTQRQMLEHEAIVMRAVLDLQDDVYEHDDDDPGVGYEARTKAVQTAVKSRLKVVGDG